MAARRYIVSALLIVLLTAGVMLLPNLTARLQNRQDVVPQIRNVNLESTERTFTGAEVVSMICNNFHNAIIARADEAADRNEAAAHCRALIAKIFRDYPEFALELQVAFDSVAAQANVECGRFLTLYDGEVVALTLIAYGVNGCSICYEADSGILLALSVNGYFPLEEWVLDESTRNYYYAEGLNDWDYAYEMPWRITKRLDSENIPYLSSIAVGVTELLFDQDIFFFLNEGSEKVIY